MTLAARSVNAPRGVSQRRINYLISRRTTVGRRPEAPQGTGPYRRRASPSLIRKGVDRSSCQGSSFIEDQSLIWRLRRGRHL